MAAPDPFTPPHPSSRPQSSPPAKRNTKPDAHSTSAHPNPAADTDAALASDNPPPPDHPPPCPAEADPETEPFAATGAEAGAGDTAALGAEGEGMRATERRRGRGALAGGHCGGPAATAAAPAPAGRKTELVAVRSKRAVEAGGGVRMAREIEGVRRGGVLEGGMEGGWSLLFGGDGGGLEGRGGRGMGRGEGGVEVPLRGVPEAEGWMGCAERDRFGRMGRGRGRW